MEKTSYSGAYRSEESVRDAGRARMPEQDIAKGIAILLVLALHTLTLHKTIYTLLGGLFGFIMPFFFFVAGYNYRPGRYSYKENVTRRVTQLLRPMLIYSVSISVIGGAYLVLTRQCTFRDVLNDYLAMLLSRHCATWFGITETGISFKIIMFFWFIQMLFTASLVFYAVAEHALSGASRFVSVVTGLMAVTMVFAHFDLHLPFYIFESPAIAAMMLFGALFGKHRLLGRHTQRRIIVLNCVVAYGMFLVLAAMFRGSGFIMGGSLWTHRLKEWDVLLSLVFSVIGSYAFVHACRCLTKTGPLGRALVWCGNNSMMLLFLHSIVQLFLCDALGLEPFRMSMRSEVSDYRTFYVFALELLFTILVIIVINHMKNCLSVRRAGDQSHGI